jgi:hypothetical protein
MIGWLNGSLLDWGSTKTLTYLGLGNTLLTEVLF